jgi:hypothetical protein
LNRNSSTPWKSSAMESQEGKKASWASDRKEARTQEPIWLLPVHPASFCMALSFFSFITNSQTEHIVKLSNNFQSLYLGFYNKRFTGLLLLIPRDWQPELCAQNVSINCNQESEFMCRHSQFFSSLLLLKRADVHLLHLPVHTFLLTEQ